MSKYEKEIGKLRPADIRKIDQNPPKRLPGRTRHPEVSAQALRDRAEAGDQSAIWQLQYEDAKKITNERLAIAKKLKCACGHRGDKHANWENGWRSPMIYDGRCKACGDCAKFTLESEP